MKSVIEQIKNSLSPSRIIGGKVAIKPKGAGEYHGLCPFHKEKTPSFTVSDEKGFYHCFGCGAHGDIFSYLMQTEGLSYKEALERLAAEAGVALPKYSPKQLEEENTIERIYQIFEIATEYYHQCLYSQEGRTALNYLRNRGLSEELIKKFKLGYAPSNHDELLKKLKQSYAVAEIADSTVMNKGKNSELYNMFRGRVIFPISNKKGRVIAFGGRILGEGEPKYLNSPDNPVFKKGQELFGLSNAHAAAFKQNEIILVEGYMDALTLINNGINNVVAPLGTAVKIDQISVLWNIVDTPIVCMDSDNAGRRAMAKLAFEALKFITPKKSLKFMVLNGAKDPDEYIAKHGVASFQQIKTKAVPLADFIFEVEQNTKSLSTPEARADLKNRLIANSENIKDPALSSNYKKYYNEKFYELFKSKRKEVANINQAAIVSSTLSQDISLESKILLSLINSPKLLNNNAIFEMLVEIELPSKELDKVRDYLLSIMNSPLQRDEELNELQSIKEYLYSTQQMKQAVNSNALANFLDNEKLSEEEAEDNVLRAFKLISLRNLQNQIESTKKEVISTSDEAAFKRLAELKRHEETIKIELGLL